MSHNLANIDGRISMAYQGETPWHKLGQRLPSMANVSDALTAANLNWPVELRDIFLQDGTRLPDNRATVRTEADGKVIPLGVVGARFRPVQNLDAFGVLQPACEEHGVTIESAGALGIGERTWMLAKFGAADFGPSAADSVRGYFLVLNAHDGSSNFFARPTLIRAICQNTINAALSANTGRTFTIRHTASADARVKEARRLVTALVDAMRKSATTFAQLAERRMSPQEIGAWIESVLPTPEGEAAPNATLKQKRADIGALVWAGKGAQLAGADGNGATAWAAYNAVVEYLDHVRPAQASSAAGQLRANNSAIFGSGWDLKSLAFQRAVDLIPVARRA
jgi:phage/plasmid-like protein (TIGR03299 family)